MNKNTELMTQIVNLLSESGLTVKQGCDLLDKTKFQMMHHTKVGCNIENTIKEAVILPESNEKSVNNVVEAIVDQLEEAVRKSNIPEEKRKWMEEVGVVELKQSMKFWAPDNNMLYSEDYLKNTPLEEIQAGYERTLKRKSNLDKGNGALDLS